jgi:hypothetical protein
VPRAPGAVADMEAGTPRTGVSLQLARVEIRVMPRAQETLGVAPRAERQVLATSVTIAEQAAAEPDPGHGATGSAGSPAGSNTCRTAQVRAPAVLTTDP